MALHDFRCPACGDVYPDVDVPIALGARAANLRCPNPVHTAPHPRLEWIPQIGRMDFGPSAGAGFKAFTIQDRDARGRVITREIDSLHTLRKVERESEQRARNGEGQPLVWRDYSQARSNRDQHTLAKDPADPHGAKVAINPKKFTPRKGREVIRAHGTV